MPNAARKDELAGAIAATRDNIRTLVEQASAASGEAEEERIADRIAEEEANLAALQSEMDGTTDDQR
ncbi:hypothetical protein [Aurantimonas sp. 22II-16-19i]|uniref:hypothetical protein n=1 Tax=Aurantimonas sp. 22II-16-19i TaxID=1317114 RepID=UPI0009F7DA6E|nr:hypothetical protein [Aurantimonas sp. 22II-16-19i]ORE91828.1 hypothetical protein ATO4_17964 [Aurantimonas sp. 22II-16-19i]